MPFPIPRSLTCSPSHMMNEVPEVSVMTAISRKAHPGSITARGPNAPFSSANAIRKPWSSASATVP
jgi:hypothetical protein